jgi:hypothetical protein
MKKLMLIACLAVVAAVVAPASASAVVVPYEFIGACTISGTAKFTNAAGVPKRLSKTPPPLQEAETATNYSFTSGEISLPTGEKRELTECSGVAKARAGGPPEPQVKASAKAVVGGAGELSCPASTNATKTPGAGYLEVPKGSEHRAEFSNFVFVGVGAVVAFTIVEPLVPAAAAGTASFASDVKGVKACGDPTNLTEPTELDFTAAASGKIG